VSLTLLRNCISFAFLLFFVSCKTKTKDELVHKNQIKIQKVVPTESKEIQKDYKKMEDSIFGLLKKEEKKLKIKDSLADIKNKKKLNEIKIKKQLNLKNRRSLKKKKPFNPKNS